jgi:hypothetical protein
LCAMRPPGGRPERTVQYMTRTTPTSFETTDLGQAAFLLARGRPLTSMDSAVGRRRIFQFPAAAQADADEYFAGGQAPARALVNALRDLKAAVLTR